MPRSRLPAGPSFGCAPLLLACFTTCLLLALNAALIHASLPALTGLLPAWLRRPKVEQTLLFVLPVALTVLQWWLVDLAVLPSRDRSNNRRRPADEPR